MEVIIKILFGLLIVASLVMIIIVMMQDTTSAGLGAGFGGGNTDSFFGRNKSKTREARLSFVTKVSGVLIGVLCLAITFMLKFI